MKSTLTRSATHELLPLGFHWVCDSLSGCATWTDMTTRPNEKIRAIGRDAWLAVDVEVRVRAYSDSQPRGNYPVPVTVSAVAQIGWVVDVPRRSRLLSGDRDSLTFNMLLTLPQETVNEVIAHLHSDQHALQSLSAVAKRLTEECRRYLFASIHIDSETKIRRWCHTIPPGEDGLSRYVRLLDLDMWEDGLRCLSALLREHPAHLYSFTQVEQLKICPLDLRKHKEKELVDFLGHLPSTVRSIYIRPGGDYSSILNFLALFPHLETTLITSPLIYHFSGFVGLPDPVRRGDLILKVCRIDTRVNILSCLTRPTTCYRMVGFGLVKVDNPAPLERFFEACSASLESVQFICCFFGECQVLPLVES